MAVVVPGPEGADREQEFERKLGARLDRSKMGGELLCEFGFGHRQDRPQEEAQLTDLPPECGVECVTEQMQDHTQEKRQPSHAVTNAACEREHEHSDDSRGQQRVCKRAPAGEHPDRPAKRLVDQVGKLRAQSQCEHRRAGRSLAAVSPEQCVDEVTGTNVSPRPHVHTDEVERFCSVHLRAVFETFTGRSHPLQGMTVHSDWGDWLPQAIEAADPDGLALWYLGCNGFVIKSAGGTTLFVDPYLGTGDPPRTVRMIPVPFDPADVASADAVLATHEHSDHVHGPSQAPILANTDARFHAPDASVAVTEEEGWCEEWGFGADQLRTVAEGDQFEVGDLTVTVGPANDPDAEHPVAYVVKHESGTFVHGGDARPGGFGDLAAHDIDIGALAFGTTGMIPDSESHDPVETTWYNSEGTLVEAARELELDRLVPTHWDMWRGLTADPTVLHHHAASFDYPRRLDIVEIGDRVDV
jgi:L-ascorbate 6-phosphate lactonase